jgi:uncharacterized membrane protein
MSRTSPAVIVGCCLLGAATGLRSQISMASAVVFAAQRPRTPAWLRAKPARPVALTLALGELVADKLPSTPKRTEPLGLGARIGLGALSSGILASSAGQGGPVPVLVGAVAAVGAAFGGMTARAALARHLPPVAVAVTEDILAATLAANAWRTVAGDT